MNVHWNPSYYLKHAWEKTNSIWGKIAIVLFYAFVWISIIAAFVQILYPHSQGIGCYLDATKSSYAHSIMTVWLQNMNIFAIFFFLYADRGGIKFWNVFMVFVAMICLSYTNLNAMAKLDSKLPADCANDAYKMYNWVNVAWMGAAAICAFVEERMDNSGTAAENQPLNP